MLDDIGGLPLHPLLVHAPVVLVPITALLTLAFLVPRWRWTLRWPIAVLAVLAAAATYAAMRSGEALRAQIGAGGEIGAAIAEHETWGKRLLLAVLVLAVVAVVAAVVATRTAGPAATLIAVVLAVAGVTAGWLTYETGDRGTRAVWCATAVSSGTHESLEACLR